MNPFKASRELTLLIPDMRKRVENFLKECKDKDVEVFVTEAWRSKIRQAYLFSIGRFGPNKTGSKVTWVRYSKHQDGVAVDIAFQKPGDIYVGLWEDVFDIAEANGLISLFRDKGVDRPHLEFDYGWKPRTYRRKEEQYMMDVGVISTAKNLDSSPNREEVIAIAAKSYKSLLKRIKTLDKKITDLSK